MSISLITQLWKPVEAVLRKEGEYTHSYHQKRHVLRGLESMFFGYSANHPFIAGQQVCIGAISENVTRSRVIFDSFIYLSSTSMRTYHKNDQIFKFAVKAVFASFIWLADFAEIVGKN